MSLRSGFYKKAKFNVLATVSALHPESGWKKSASARGVSHFAQASHTSIQAILESVAEKYFISKDPKDYIYVVYRAVTQDAPNGNGDAFSRKELLSWNKGERKPVYQTFEFKPRFVNHQADDLRMARGVVVDTHYNEVDPEDCFIEVLVAVDAKKDPILAQGLLDGVISQCSMGCDALHTECNVCGNLAYSERDYCAHIKPGNRMKMHKAPDGTDKLAFEWCYEVTFQELSDVDDPADKKADVQEILAVDELPSAKITAQSQMLDLKARIKRLEAVTQPDQAFRLAASQGDEGHMKQGKKNPAEVPEHHALAACYAKHHDLHFGSHEKAMKAAMEECGKSEDEIRTAWSKKMAEDMPHPKSDAICASLNAQLHACGDIKKAVKRTAEDHEVEHDIVGKCAEYMKTCNKMAGYTSAAAEAKEPEHKAADPAPKEPEKKAEEKAPEAPAEKKAEDGPPAEVQKKIDEAAKTAAQAVKTAAEKEDEKAKEAARVAAEVADKKAVADKEEADKKAAKEKEDKECADKEAAAKAAQEAAKPAAPAAPAQEAAAAPDAAAATQAADAPNKKTLGDMGVKTAANEFPFAKHYQDVAARKVASGEVHVTRAGKLVFTVPAGRIAAPQDALKLVASIGLIGAMKKLAMTKTADAGIAEGAVTDLKGGRAPLTQSSQENAVFSQKEMPKVNPDSATAAGPTTDEKDKVEHKNLGNSNVRDQASGDLKGGREPSKDSVVADGEHPSAKLPHDTKNVGSDNILSGRQVDMVLAGIDPKVAELLKPRLASLVKEAAEPSVEDKAKEAARIAAEKEKEDKAKEAARVAQAAKDKEHEKEMDKKARLAAQAQLEKFTRGLKLIARRFALNLEASDLKHEFGAVLSTRHEASGFEGMDSDLVLSVVDRGFSQNAAFERTVDHMVRRAHEIAAMPDDALKAIEADLEHLEPIHPSGASEPEHHAEHEEHGEHEAGRAAFLRRRAANGSMPTLRPATVDPVMPSKGDLVRQAIGGGVFESKYSGR